MECNKDFNDMTSPALLEVERRKNNENGINRKIDKMLKEERMRKIITELSREIIASKRQWLEQLVRTKNTNEKTQYLEELKEDYQGTIEHTKNMMIELVSFYLEVPLIESKIQCYMILALNLKF